MEAFLSLTISSKLPPRGLAGACKLLLLLLLLLWFYKIQVTKLMRLKMNMAQGLRNLEGLPASTADTQRKIKNNE